MKLISTLTAIIVILPSSILDLGIFKIIYYIWLIIVYIYSLFKFKTSPNIIGVLLLFVCFFSLIINSVSPIFQPWFRFLSFMLLFLAVGPFNNDNNAHKFHNEILIKLLNIIVIMVIISFFTYFTKQHIFFKQTSILLNGLFNHSMLLGPMAAISVIYSVYRYNVSRKRIQIIIALICSLTVLMSSSRAAIVGLIISLLYLNWVSKKSYFSFFKKIIVVLIVIMLSFPLWKPYAEGVIVKQEYAEKTGSFTASRNDKWENRFYEIKNNPIFGVGFASVDPIKSILDYDKDSGTLEPGSSWLFIISSIGISGLFLIIAMFYNILKKNNHTLLKSLIVFFSIHMFAEGFIFATGSLLCIFLWLLIGCGYQTKISYNQLNVNNGKI